MQSDRREFQRLKLSKPILASIDDANALILDVGMAGALLEHYGVVTPGSRFTLKFRWQSEDIEFPCEVVRSTVVREPAGDGQSAVSHTGVHFVDQSQTAAARLHDLMSTFVRKILDAQRANAAGEQHFSAGATILANIGGARRKRTKGFLSFRLKDGNWWRIPTDSPRQPADGFTVPAWEDEHELELLCQTFAEADEEGRDLIRLLAELSGAPD